MAVYVMNTVTLASMLKQILVYIVIFSCYILQYLP